MSEDPGPATRLLDRLSRGDASAADELLPLVYEELRRLAVGAMRDQGRGHTLQPTALVHEAWLKLSEGGAAGFEGRSHFLGVAARAMRQVLVDHARAKRAAKRGGGEHTLALDEALALAEARTGDLLALDAALERLAARDAELARVVELRFFGGLTIEEAAAELGLSRRSVDRAWRTARAWLKRELDRELEA